MKLIRAVQVHGAVCEEMERETSFSFAHTLCLAKARLDPHVQFFVKKEMELIKLRGAPREDGSIVDREGHYEVKQEEAKTFFAEKAELDSVEVKVEKVPAPTRPERITGKNLELLLEILDFGTEREDAEREGEE